MKLAHLVILILGFVYAYEAKTVRETDIKISRSLLNVMFVPKLSYTKKIHITLNEDMFSMEKKI